MKTPEERREYQRKWREANAEKRKEYNKKYHQEYYQKNKDTVLEKNRKWDEENREKRREISRRFYDKRGKETAAKWRANNPDKVKSTSHNYLERNRKELCDKQKRINKTPNGIYIRYKHSAKKRNILFSISENDFFDLLGQPCVYCGLLDVPSGVDRVDNNLGYTKENCAPCCPECNYFKRARSIEKFIAHAKRITQHNT